MFDIGLLLWALVGLFGEFICSLEDMDAPDASVISLADIVIIVGGPISLFFILRHHLNKIKIDFDL
jgi:hypothetical protein